MTGQVKVSIIFKRLQSTKLCSVTVKPRVKLKDSIAANVGGQQYIKYVGENAETHICRNADLQWCVTEEAQICGYVYIQKGKPAVVYIQKSRYAAMCIYRKADTRQYMSEGWKMEMTG